MDGRRLENGNTPSGILSNTRDRFFDAQNYPHQNPYDTPLPNYYPAYQGGYEYEPETADYGNGRFGHGQGQGQATFHQHVYSTLGGGGGGSSGGGGGHKSKNHALAMSALTLLAFLFFIQMLQSCLKEQMTSLNPTVMVMTAGTSRFRKTGTASTTGDANKELFQNDPHEAMISSVADNVDLLTNDQGDVFYGPAPKISFKLDNSFVARSADSVPKETREET
ncbi:uncharacterized protein LOC129566114 [Sitodiplosis mosellana]|uniref:uncharacterized protein LOC129566114 n=1 Tax=Sitodiplosis mosellana TaxID=263140 RepID=UPI0024445CEB|nr:uncharacterized protein LOC129566114 [Sitodiplosis mosellana]